MLMADHYIISCQQDHLASLLCLSTVYPLLSNACAAPSSYWILVAFHRFRYIRILLVQNDGMDLHRPGLTWPFFCAALGFSFPRSPRPRRDTCFPSIRLPIIGSGTASIICVFSFLSLFVCVIFPCADVVACPCFSFLFIRHRPEGLKCFFFC